ncbi:MAG TPA: hypothetical protein VKT76_16475 [Bradyrhizobium sp.]|nr:hypothetical protein [Bradyrhizobium sp.]
MTRQKKSTERRDKSGRFTIGADAFAKISAVEGNRMTPAMKKRASDARAKGLSGEEYRQTIIRTYRKS